MPDFLGRAMRDLMAVIPHDVTGCEPVLPEDVMNRVQTLADTKYHFLQNCLITHLPR